VVATEMGKLANDSSASAKSISDFLNRSNSDMNHVTAELHAANDLSQSHLHEIESIKMNLNTIMGIFDDMK